MQNETIHIPVLLNEVIDSIQAAKGGVFLDCTFGGGGHSRKILEANPQNQVWACDRDPEAVKRAEGLSREFPERFFIHESRFSELKENLGNLKFDGILADLGFSSDQMESERGFSFKDAESLDMRMDPRLKVTASDLINKLSASELKKIFQKGGVRQGTYMVAKAIEDNRPIENARQLELLICGVVPRAKSTNPATVFFQALRIAVNEEFEEIEALLSYLPGASRPGCRACVIGFHSLEDRIVTGKFREWSQGESMPALWAGSGKSTAPIGKLLTSDAICASEEEVRGNPRSRSAMLRVFVFN
jgi:16S rRNA (cytosine1402-N4)-methyltransferase